MRQHLRALLAASTTVLAACGTPAIAPPLRPGARAVEALGPVGTAHPFKMIHADPHARWVALCQAREDSDGDERIASWWGYPTMGGDTLRPYLVFGDGPGELIDDYIGADREGEHIVFIRNGRLLIHHVTAGRTEDLSARGADAADDGPHEWRHRAASVGIGGRTLVYHVARPRRGIFEVILRDFQTGDEVRFKHAGRLVRAWLSFDGDWVLVSAVIDDRNGDGELVAPRSRGSYGARACWGSRPTCTFDDIEEGADPPALLVAPASGGSLRQIPGMLFDVQDLILARERGAIVAHGTDGTITEWAPAACQARILAVSPSTRRTLVQCGERGSSPGRIEIHGAGVHHALSVSKLDPYDLPVDRDDSSGRFAAYGGRDNAMVVDLVALREWAIPAGTRLVEIADDGVVLEEAGRSKRWDPAAGTFEALPDAPRPRGEDEVLSISRDGRRLEMLHPPPRSVQAPEAATTATGDRDSTKLLDLNPLDVLLPVGPLVWR